MEHEPISTVHHMHNGEIIDSHNCETLDAALEKLVEWDGQKVIVWAHESEEL